MKARSHASVLPSVRLSRTLFEFLSLPPSTGAALRTRGERSFARSLHKWFFRCSRSPPPPPPPAAGLPSRRGGVSALQAGRRRRRRKAVEADEGIERLSCKQSLLLRRPANSSFAHSAAPSRKSKRP